MSATSSIQSALIRSIVIVALILSVVGALVGAVSAFFAASDIQDEVLDSVAMLIRSGQLEAENTRLRRRQYASDENIIVQRLDDQQGVFDALPLHQWSDGFYTLPARGESWRIRLIGDPQGARHVVAQQASLRYEAAFASMSYVLLPLGLMTLTLLVAVPVLVRRQLSVLRSLSARMQTQAPDQPLKLSNEPLPNEIKPFARAIDGLFERNQTLLARQRRFIADAAHELRTPVAALKLWSENVNAATSEAEREVRQSRVKLGLERLEGLVVRLLDLARLQNIEARAGDVVPLCDIVRDVVADIQPLAEKKHIDVGLAHHDHASMRDVNQSLKQLVRNAIENAINHSPNQSVVDISILSLDNGSELVVEDNGPGIPEEDIVHVTEPFYRSSMATASGSGLGLAICKEIAQLNGGVLRVSNRESGGVRFSYFQPQQVIQSADSL